MKLKPWGGHHIPAGLVLSLIGGPLANALFWVGKELGEATERAGGTRQALTTFTFKTAANPGGIWEPMDFITPSIAGLIMDSIMPSIAGFIGALI